MAQGESCGFSENLNGKRLIMIEGLRMSGQFKPESSEGASGDSGTTLLALGFRIPVDFSHGFELRARNHVQSAPVAPWQMRH